MPHSNNSSNNQGKKSLNLMHYKDGRVVILGGKTSVHCQAGVSVLCHIQITVQIIKARKA